MTRSKNTKKALLASILSIILCIAMLVGSTFAWFTDSVTSGKNKIVAGNLDVELKYSKDLTNWNDVEGSTELFNKYALWEPGHTEVVYLKVSNVGSLALKFRIMMNIINEQGGKNVYGNDFNLSSYLKYGIKVSPTTTLTREEAKTVVESDPKALTRDWTGSATLYPVESGERSETCFAIIVYMPETVDNEANYRGITIPTIELGVNLMATQVDSENDSFDNTYDKDINIILTAADLAKKLESYAPQIVLGSDITMPTETPTIMNSKNIDLGDNSMSATTFTTFRDGVDITISNGTVTQVAPENADQDSYPTNPFLLEFWGAGNNVLENVTVNAIELAINNTNAINIDGCAAREYGCTMPVLTLKAGTVVNGDIYVQNGGTLIIEEGVVINGKVESFSTWAEDIRGTVIDYRS